MALIDAQDATIGAPMTSWLDQTGPRPSLNATALR